MTKASNNTENRLNQEHRPEGFQITKVYGNLQMRGDEFIPYNFKGVNWSSEMKDSIFDTFASEIALSHKVVDADELYDDIDQIVQIDFGRDYFEVFNKVTGEEIGSGEYLNF